jgi:hypothetical protein
MAGTPGKDGVVVSFEDRMNNSSDPAEQLRWAKLIIKVKEEELALTTKYLREAFDVLNADLKQGDKCKGNKPHELAAKIAGMARTAGGLFLYYSAKYAQVKELLAPVVNAVDRDTFGCAIEARYKLQHQAIVLESLERREIK